MFFSLPVVSTTLTLTSPTTDLVLIYFSIFKELFYKSLDSPTSSLSFYIKLWINIFTNSGFNIIITKIYISCPHLFPKQQVAVCKEPRSYVKEIHLLILKHLPEGQKLAGTLSGDRMLADAIFTNSLYLDGTGGCRFLHSHSKLLTVVAGEYPLPHCPALPVCSIDRHAQRAAAPTPPHATRRTRPEATVACSPHRGHSLSTRLRQMGVGLHF